EDPVRRPHLSGIPRRAPPRGAGSARPRPLEDVRPHILLTSTSQAGWSTMERISGEALGIPRMQRTRRSILACCLAAGLGAALGACQSGGEAASSGSKATQTAVAPPDTNLTAADWQPVEATGDVMLQSPETSPWCPTRSRGSWPRFGATAS